MRPRAHVYPPVQRRGQAEEFNRSQGAAPIYVSRETLLMLCIAAYEAFNMAGEVREKLANLRAARNDLVGTLSTRMDELTAHIGRVKRDGLSASDLVEAEITAYATEVQEIQSEFAPLTNGPPGPLSDGSGLSASSPVLTGTR